MLIHVQAIMEVIRGPLQSSGTFLDRLDDIFLCQFLLFRLFVHPLPLIRRTLSSCVLNKLGFLQ